MNKVSSMFHEYLEFFANFNVLGLAIGLMIGSNLKEVAGDFIDGIIMPFIKPILKTLTGGKDLKFNVPGTEVELDLDKVTASTIKFAALSIIIFIMLQLGVKIKKSPNSGGMKGLAFIYDPDGYLVEILPKQNPFPQQDTDCNGVSLTNGGGYQDNSKS